MIRLKRATEQHSRDAQTEQKRDQLSYSREETLRLGQRDGMVLHKVNCSRYLNIGGTEWSVQCQYIAQAH